MVGWMCGISLKDRGTGEELRRLVGVEPITASIGSGGLRWYGHVMGRGDGDWLKRCVELRAEDRLEDQERHGWRVWKQICPNLRSTGRMSMMEVDGEGI